MRKNRTEVIAYINSLKDYEGYVQFSHRPIEIERDVFIGRNPKVEDEKGFVLEAHFFNGTDSVTIRQINSEWSIDEHPSVPLDDVQTYHAIEDLEVKMAQIWRPQRDDHCEGLEVMKLEKVVFVGFEQGEQDDNSTL